MSDVITGEGFYRTRGGKVVEIENNRYYPSASSRRWMAKTAPHYVYGDDGRWSSCEVTHQDDIIACVSVNAPSVTIPSNKVLLLIRRKHGV